MRLQNPQMRFEELYRIYDESFPDEEKRTKEGQRRVLEDPMYRLLVMEEHGRILAFLGYWELPDCCFVEHLATTEACRGKGYGKRLLGELTGEAGKPIFLEIEPVTEEDPMTRRRKGFYERLGFVANSFPYEQMPLKEGDRPIPLWVMSYGRAFSEEEFLPYKKEIYHYVYGVEV